LDGLFAVIGTTSTSIPTPPFQGALGIAPFQVLFVFPQDVWPFNHFDLDGTIPNDPSISGVTILLQALVGPSFSAPKSA
jgi:hypothetical protein